jgi:hypothetical protein
MDQGETWRLQGGVCAITSKGPDFSDVLSREALQKCNQR